MHGVHRLAKLLGGERAGRDREGPVAESAGELQPEDAPTLGVVGAGELDPAPAHEPVPRGEHPGGAAADRPRGRRVRERLDEGGRHRLWIDPIANDAWRLVQAGEVVEDRDRAVGQQSWVVLARQWI